MGGENNVSGEDEELEKVLGILKTKETNDNMSNNKEKLKEKLKQRIIMNNFLSKIQCILVQTTFIVLNNLISSLKFNILN